MEFLVGQIEKDNIKLYEKNNKDNIKEFSINDFPCDVCLGDCYEIDDKERKTLLSKTEIPFNHTGLYKIIYVDGYLVLLQNLHDLEIKKSELIKNLPPNIEYGDILVHFKRLSINKKYEYSIFQKHSKDDKQRNLEELYLITKIDSKNIYLLKNGSKKVTKLEKIQGNYAPLDLVYIDKEDGQIKVVKDDKISPYFINFLSKHDKNKIFNKNHFKITEWVVEFNHKYVLSLLDKKTLKDIVYVADYELYPNARIGDPYYKIEIGKTSGFEFDFKNDYIREDYSKLIKNQFLEDDKNLSNEELFKNYSEKLEILNKKIKYFEKLNKSIEKYYQKNPLEYTKYEIEDYYKVREYDYSNGKYVLERLGGNIVSDEENDERIDYVVAKDLPEKLRVGDCLVKVLEGVNKKTKYYFSREKIKDELLNLYDRVVCIKNKLGELCK